QPQASLPLAFHAIRCPCGNGPMYVARSAKLGGELLACAAYKGRRTRFAIGRDDRVQTLSARDAAPAFEGQGPRVVPHVFKDILHHDTPAAWAVHRASPPERNQVGVVMIRH